MARTREALIDAGLRLAERTGLTGLSVNLIVAEAGVAKGTFFHHFGDRASYLLALHREFHERLATQIQAAIAGMSPGRDRLIAVANTYLDGCLRDRGVRALLLEARAEPAVTDEITRRNKPAPSCVDPISPRWEVRTPTKARSCGSAWSQKLRSSNTKPRQHSPLCARPIGQFLG